MSIITILLYQHTLTILKYFGILIFDVEAIVLPGKLCRTESLFLRHGPFLICLGGLVFFGCPIKTCRVCPLTAGLQRHGYAFPWDSGSWRRNTIRFPLFQRQCCLLQLTSIRKLWQGAAAVDCCFPNGKLSANPKAGFTVTNCRTTTPGAGDVSSLRLWLASAPEARPPAGQYLGPWAGGDPGTEPPKSFRQLPVYANSSPICAP